MSQYLQEYNGFADRPIYKIWDLDTLIPLHSIEAFNKNDRDKFFRYIKDQYSDRRVEIERIDKTGIHIIKLEDIDV